MAVHLIFFEKKVTAADEAISKNGGSPNSVTVIGEFTSKGRCSSNSCIFVQLKLC